MAKAAYLRLDADKNASLESQAKANAIEEDCKQKYDANVKKLEAAEHRLEALRMAEQTDKAEKQRKAVDTVLKNINIDLEKMEAANAAETANFKKLSVAAGLAHNSGLGGALKAGSSSPAEQQLDAYAALKARKQREQAEAEMRANLASTTPTPSAPPQRSGKEDPN